MNEVPTSTIGGPFHTPSTHCPTGPFGIVPSASAYSRISGRDGKKPSPIHAGW